MKTTSKVAFTLCLFLAVGLAVSACNRSETADSDAGFTGVYTLVSVDGTDVPANVSHENVAFQVLSGTFTINEDGTCSTKTTFVPPSGTEASSEVAATYKKDGSTLTMQWEGAGETAATISGNTLRMDNEGMIFVYER